MDVSDYLHLPARPLAVAAATYAAETVTWVELAPFPGELHAHTLTDEERSARRARAQRLAA